MNQLKNLAPDILDDFYQPLLILDRELKVLWGNRSYYDFFRTSPLESEGSRLNDLGSGEWNISLLLDRLKDISFNYSEVNDLEVTRHFSDIGQRSMLLNARQIDSHHRDSRRHILLAIEDITDRKLST